MLALTASFWACGDKDPNENNIQAVDPGVILADPGEVEFSQVDLSQTDVQTLRISNNGNGTLVITDVKLVEESIDDKAGREIFIGQKWTRKARLAQNEFIELELEYTPRDTTSDFGYVEITSNDPDNGIFKVSIKSSDLTPRVFTEPKVSFGRVSPVTDETRDKTAKKIEIKNVGQSPLKISRIEISPQSSEFRVMFPTDDDLANDKKTGSFPMTLEPAGIVPVRVYFNPSTREPSTAVMFIYSNDPKTPSYKVDLIGNSGEPCIEVITGEDEINFGEAGIGFDNKKTITIRNCSPGELELQGVEVCTDIGGNCDAASDVFKADTDSLPTFPKRMAGFERRSIVLVYTPEDEVVQTGKLILKSNDSLRPMLSIPITGKGTNNQCPTALAEAKLVDTNRYQTTINTIPYKSVEFRGLNSTDANGAIKRYQWSIIKAPINSTSRLEPSSEIENPTLLLDLAGEYIIELIVYDDQGTASCGDQALVTIRATPDEDIHIQLVWNTPADQDQTNTEGTDMDVHFRHPNGIWNEDPWDIFYGNKTGEWGALGPDDDPSLDVDDTDGAGPENINLDNPEAGKSYAVGVYYFNSYAFGVSYATVRIFIKGQQRFEKKDVFLDSTGTFWFVATIEWPSGRIFAVDQQFDDFP